MNMIEKDEVQNVYVFTKDGCIVPVRKENPIKGETWEKELVPYSEIKKLNLGTVCIEPEIKANILVSLKMRREFEGNSGSSDRQKVKEKNETNGILLSDLQKIDLTRKDIRGMVTPDGQRHNVTSWAVFLVDLANYLESINKINDSNVPIDDYAGRKRYLINSENIHKSGVKFISTHKTNKGLHIETNYPPNLIVKNSIHLIEYCNEDPSRFKVIM